MTKEPLKPLNDPSHPWNKSFAGEEQWAIETLQAAAKTPAQKRMTEVLSKRGLRTSLNEDISRARIKHMDALRREHVNNQRALIAKQETERKAQITERLSR